MPLLSHLDHATGIAAFSAPHAASASATAQKMWPTASSATVTAPSASGNHRSKPYRWRPNIIVAP